MKPTRLLQTMILATLASSASAAVLDVNCAGGTYLDIQSAVNAALPGDVIVVQSCSYPNGFTISGKNDLQIVAADLAAGFFGAFPVGAGVSLPTPPAQVYEMSGNCVTIDSSRNISIVGLLLEACRGNGFEVTASENIELHGNWLFYADRDGVALVGSRNITLSGNFLYGAVLPNQWGVSIDSSSEFVRIHNNRIMKNFQGILMKGQYTDVINNEVSNNTRVGIFVSSPSSTLARNLTRDNDNGGAGVQIDFTALPFNTCLVGNDTNGGILPWAVGCQSDNN